jgi:hypothetical protein
MQVEACCARISSGFIGIGNLQAALTDCMNAIFFGVAQ